MVICFTNPPHSLHLSIFFRVSVKDWPLKHSLQIGGTVLMFKKHDLPDQKAERNKADSN